MHLWTLLVQANQYLPEFSKKKWPHQIHLLYHEHVKTRKRKEKKEKEKYIIKRIYNKWSLTVSRKLLHSKLYQMSQNYGVADYRYFKNGNTQQYFHRWLIQLFSSSVQSFNSICQM